MMPDASPREDYLRDKESSRNSESRDSPYRIALEPQSLENLASPDARDQQIHRALTNKLAPLSNPFASLGMAYHIDPYGEGSVVLGEHPINELLYELHDKEPIKTATDIAPMASWRVTNPYRVNPMTGNRPEQFAFSGINPDSVQIAYTGSAPYSAPDEVYYQIPIEYLRTHVLEPKNDFTLDPQKPVFFIPVFNLLEQGLWGYTYIGQGKAWFEMHIASDYQRVNTLTHEGGHTDWEYETQRRTEAKMNVAPSTYDRLQLAYRLQPSIRRIAAESQPPQAHTGFPQIDYAERDSTNYLGAAYHASPADQGTRFVRHPWPSRTRDLESRIRKAA